jgi:type I restriction enzyme S subunit
MSLPLVALGELFEIGSSKRVFKSEWQSEGVPFYRARELVRLAKEGNVACELFISPAMYRTYAAKYGAPKPGDILVTGVGTLGVCYVVDDSTPFYFKDGNIIWLRNRGKAHAGYVKHAFSSRHVKQQIDRSVGTTVGTFTIERANETTIPLPPLPEQKRIAAILDAADALRAKRRESIEQLDSLTQATFLEMFGDPVTNPKGWPTRSGSQMATRIKVGIVVKPASYYCVSGVPALRSLNIRTNHINATDLVYISESDNTTVLGKSRVWLNDILIVRTGQPGTAAVVTRAFDGVNAIDIIIMTPDLSQVHPAYVCCFLNSDGGKRMVGGAERGQIQKHFNVGALNSALIPLPPLDLQTRFASIVDSIEHQKARLKAHLVELDALFSSLQSRAFNGELVA